MSFILDGIFITFTEKDWDKKKNRNPSEIDSVKNPEYNFLCKKKKIFKD